MKKQFITGVLLLAVTAFGFSTFTSCKDTDEDFRNEMLSQQVSLKTTLQKLQDQLKGCSDDCKAKIDSLKEELKKCANKDDVYTKEKIDDLLKQYVALSTWNETINGENGVLERLRKLEEESHPADKLKEEEVNSLLNLIALEQYVNAITDFFKEEGGLAELQATVGDLHDVLYGTETEKGLIDKVTDLSAWFEGKDWTVQEFQTAIDNGIWLDSRMDALDEVKKLYDEGLLDKDMLEALKENYAGVIDMYEKIWKDAQLPEGAEDWWNYAEVMQNIMDNSADIAALKEDVEKLLNRLNDMVTSLVLQASHNSVFNSVNTPFGINSMVLMTVYGEIATQVREFPVSGVGAECYNNEDINWSDMTSDFYRFEDRDTKMIVALDEDKEAKLGNLWFTVNPATVNNLDLKEFSIVNSVENEVVKVKNVYKDDETVLKFGVSSRAAGNGNGLYKADVTVAPDDLDKIKVHIESGLVESLKNAVKNHTASDMVTMLKTVYNQLQDICDANALRYTGKYADKDDNGNWIETQQKVYSNYGIAATAFKPLSYATLKGSSIGGHLPTISPIEIDKSLVNLDLGNFTVNNKDFNLKLNFGEPVFTPLGTITVTTNVELTADDGQKVTGPVTIDITKQAQEIQNSVTGAISSWIGTGDNNIDARVEKAIWYALFNGSEDPKYKYDPDQPTGVVTSLVNQVNDMMGSIQDKLDSLVEKINSEYLGKVNSLIGKYNTVAERINRALKDPNHYLQSVMLYRKAGKLALNGHTPEVELPFGILSTNPKQPTQFKGAGEAISLWATSYTFETVAPAFKKFVGVVSVKDQDGNLRKDLADEANATLAKVMPGDKTRVALDVKNAKGGTFTYEIAFQALDYTGHTSTVKCYLQVVR